MYGDGPGECFEGNTTLAALERASPSACGSACSSPGMTYRHPSVFAAEAITIDHASGGRLELAYGAAWFDEEHRELGIPFPPTEGSASTRSRRRCRSCAACSPTDDFTFEGAALPGRATRRCDPRPVQQPHPPIWIGASGEQRMMPIAARYADVWHCFGAARVARARSRQRLERACARRPGATRRRSCGRRRSRSRTTSTTSPATIDAWRDAGFGYLVCGWPARGVVASRSSRARFCSPG